MKSYRCIKILKSETFYSLINTKIEVGLEGDDPGGGAFALFLHPHPAGFRQIMCPHPGEFAHFKKKKANSRGLARGRGGGWALLELTDALLTHVFESRYELSDGFKLC